MTQARPHGCIAETPDGDGHFRAYSKCNALDVSHNVSPSDQMTEMKTVKTWWLKSPDNIDVSTDGKGHFSLEVLPEFSPVEFKESDHQQGSLETYREKISKLLGVDCHWVRGLDIYE